MMSLPREPQRGKHRRHAMEPVVVRHLHELPLKRHLLVEDEPSIDAVEQDAERRQKGGACRRSQERLPATADHQGDRQQPGPSAV